MKKLLLILIPLFMYQCEKEKIQSTTFRNITINSQVKNSNKSDISLVIENVSTYEDMLWFRDLESIKKAIEDLERYQEEDIELFNDSYITLSEEEIANLSWDEFEDYQTEIANIQANVGFSDIGIYNEFENILSFNSLRKEFYELENIFLSNDDDDWTNYPEHPFIPFEATQTVLNQFEEVRIDDEIYKLTADGYFLISNSDYQAVVSLRTNIESESENIEFVNTSNSNSNDTDNSSNGNNNSSNNSSNNNSNNNNSSTSSNGGSSGNTTPGYQLTCRAGKHKWGKKSFPVSGNHTLIIKWRVGVITTIWGNRFAYAKSVNFFNKKRTKSYTKVQVYGHISDDLDCTNAIEFNTLGSSQFADNNKKKLKHKVSIQTVTQSGWIKGYHESHIKGNIVAYNSTLTWW